MYTQRVKLFSGKTPIILITPYAAEAAFAYDYLLSEIIHNRTNCSAIVNCGWKKAKNYDYNSESADCNNISHLTNEVIEEEFLKPIIREKNKFIKKFKECNIFIITQTANLTNNTICIGYGLGIPNSLSTENWRVNLLASLLQYENFQTFSGKANGNYAAWSINELNQFFRKHEYNNMVKSMRLYISHDLCNTEENSIITANRLASVFNDFINYESYNRTVTIDQI